MLTEKSVPQVVLVALAVCSHMATAWLALVVLRFTPLAIHRLLATMLEPPAGCETEDMLYVLYLDRLFR
jgi:hypothetical protein